MSTNNSSREQFRRQVVEARRSFSAYEQPKKDFLRREVVTRPQRNESAKKQ